MWAVRVRGGGRSMSPSSYVASSHADLVRDMHDM
jgi:hypothetical protein